MVGTRFGYADLVNSGLLPPTRTQFGVPALPAGVLLYATLFTEVGGRWDHYQTVSFGVDPQIALFISPPGVGAPGTHDCVDHMDHQLIGSGVLPDRGHQALGLRHHR
ncbi:MAG: hypothetical protein M3083_12125 [Actinomycetota bacterium]|nr:hypothetical protein [Actinomycetota bacterium]